MDFCNLLFFADYSAPTTEKRKTFSSAMKMVHEKGLRPFLIHPATLKLRLGTGPKLFDDPALAMDFVRREPPAGGNAGTTRREGVRRNLFSDGSGSGAFEPARAQEAAAHTEDIIVDP